ncbi:conserved hypothetical protein [Clostridium carboxidivorans P7]|uniref:Uncharacterized protein n=1 Tax=Clostridium carboxidivorans P7 TaxID=536227 RepID=C6PP61_9CLOT|nr:hypothetical protein [Clostridium carboxidivorans]EET88939.1 conserved hypothetical protein [Clostridium carboxidivorans P7]
MNFDKEDFKAYLTMIENVISRMATNSFIVKGWTITMISAILVLAVSKNLNYKVYIIAIVADISFCFIDCFYLRTEKLYRNMYKSVLGFKNNLKQINFFDLNASEYKDKNTSPINVFLSCSIWPLYLVILASIVFIA